MGEQEIGACGWQHHLEDPEETVNCPPQIEEGGKRWEVVVQEANWMTLHPTCHELQFSRCWFHSHARGSFQWSWVCTQEDAFSSN